jgi:hypothetical protein
MVSRIYNGVPLRLPLLTFWGFVFGICNAAPLPECPPTILVAQLAQAAPDGWALVPYSGEQRLARITFKLRSDSGELRPDEEMGKAGKQMLTWNVEGLKELEQICVYSGTLARLSRPIADAVSRCEVRESKLPSGAVQITSKCH